MIEGTISFINTIDYRKEMHWGDIKKLECKAEV